MRGCQTINYRNRNGFVCPVMLPSSKLACQGPGKLCKVHQPQCPANHGVYVGSIKVGIRDSGPIGSGGGPLLLENQLLLRLSGLIS
jgi:hypothetical protein